MGLVWEQISLLMKQMLAYLLRLWTALFEMLRLQHNGNASIRKQIL
jgi:hypothetical protein